MSGVQVRAILWLVVLSLVALPQAARAGAPIVADDTPPASVASTQYEVTLDETTRWEPYDSAVRFAIAGLDGSGTEPLVEACFRWKLDGTQFRLCHAPERVAKAADGTMTFAATVPFGWKDSPTGVAKEPLVPLLPVAELRIRLLDPAALQAGAEHPVLASYVREIGVTSKAISAVLAIVFFALAGVVLYGFARALRVPGMSLLLRVISSEEGWASLSQFQIVLWTMLIATGAVYVVTLTGSLLVITSGTLALLGIAGATAVGSQVTGTLAAAQADTLAPGAVADLALEGNPAADGAVLSWSPVAGAKIRYTVQHSADGGQTWVTETTVLEGPRVRLVGLTPAAIYGVRVLATNGMGAGGAAQVTFTTGQRFPTQPGALGSIQNLGTLDAPASREVTLAWGALSGASGYRIQFRPHQSDRDWQFVGTGGSASKTAPSRMEARLGGLSPDTDYDVRVVPFDAAGDGPPSNILRVRSGPREPRWTDLVTSDSRIAEVDVTRVQMLLFTVISAFFVALKIAESGTIPEIPSSYVTLMGISNGVYLTAKFVGRPVG